MAEVGAMAKPNTVVDQRPKREPEEGVLLAVALAAALVEYRRHKERQGGQSSLGHNGTNWRVMARWEQLSRPAGRKVRGLK
jgi:hypothetical protein